MGDIAEKIYSIAVDGPSGAGKSSLAKAIAGRIFVELEASGRHVHVTAQQAL